MSDNNILLKKESVLKDGYDFLLIIDKNYEDFINRTKIN